MAHLDPEELMDDLRAAGLRLTAPRRAICRVLAESHDDHLTAAELGSRAEAVAGSRIDPSTVYRTIDAFEATGRLHHVHLGHGPSVVHLSDRRDHHHLVCEVCDRTVDVPMSELSGLFAHLEDRYGFLADSVHFAMIGRCVDHAENKR